MKIVIALPCAAGNMSGGLKVLFQYANGLADEHDITILHVPFYSPISGFIGKLKALVQYMLGRFGLYKWQADWIDLRPQVKQVWCHTISDFEFSEQELVICSFWHTAYWLRQQNLSIEMCYLVQEYEYYRSADERTREIMHENFQADFDFLCISPVIVELLETFSNRVFYMPNGIELAAFICKDNIESDQRKLIMFPAREEEFKRTQDAILAISRLEQQYYSEYRFACFGRSKPENLPEYIEFYDSPTNENLCELLNQTAIFITPSLYEGWGLPGAEAMACGVALISTDNGGVRAYAEHEKTALIVQAEDINGMALAIQTLIEQPDLRHKLAQNGHNNIRTFTWEKAINRLNRHIADHYH